MTTDPFAHDRYLIRRKVFKILGGAFHVYDNEGNVVGYARQRFKMKEDIRIYTGEDMTTELLTILARSVIDFSAAYDVVDPRDGTKVGVLRRKGLRSVVRDVWDVLDASENQIGTLMEDSAGLAVIRRVVTNLIPQNYDLMMDGARVADLKQRFNPFVYKLDVDLSGDAGGRLDRRLAMAAGVLLGAIEGRQS